MRLEHHLVGGYVHYISPHIIILSRYTEAVQCTGPRMGLMEIDG